MLQQRTYIATGERIRNYLGIGFVLSLLLNLLLAPFYPELKEQVERVKPEIFHITHPTLITTPPPKPTPPPKQRTQSHAQTAHNPIALTPPKITPTSGPAQPPYVLPSGAATDGTTVTGGISTSAPTTGTGTTEPSCATPHQDASVIDPVSPDYPDSARDLGLGPVSVLIAVTIDEKGRLVDSKIFRSSNNAAIDQAALRAARASTYTPKIENCSPVEGTYIFHADFQDSSRLLRSLRI